MYNEAEVYKTIAKYISIKYPNVIFRFDFAAGLYLSVFQSKLHKRLNPVRGYPDLFIAYPTKGYSGLFIEIKSDKANPFKKNGELRSNEHLTEQQNVLKRLNESGYKALFGVGVESCFKIIDEYLSEL